MKEFLKDLQYVHVVTALIRDEQRRPEFLVWAYNSAEDAQKRFERLIAMHKAYGERSPLIKTETFLTPIYEKFEQSVMDEAGSSGTTN